MNIKNINKTFITKIGDAAQMRRFIILALVISIGLFSNWVLHAQQATPTITKGKQSDLKRMTATFSGNVLWKGQDLSHTNVSVYRDEKLKDLYTSGISKAGTGEFTLRVEPGRYYIVAYVDVDHSGKFDEGDGYGVLGVKDWSDGSQKHVAIEIGAHTAIKGIQIPITARLQNIDEKQTLVPSTAYRPSEYQQFKTALSKATSGLRGTLTNLNEKETDQSQRIILAYTDTSWKYRAGIALVDEKTNNWEIRLRPGKYYLMAIVDRNASNKLDDGDTFGFYGIKDFKERGAFPEPVLVKPNAFVDDIEIHLSATYAAKNIINNKENTTIIFGRVYPIPQTETEVRIEVYDDPAFVKPIATTITKPDGTYKLQLPSGEYYILANHDFDGNGRYSTGDRLGGLGTESITTKPPAAVAFDTGETRAVNVQLSAQYDAEGQLVPLNEVDIERPIVNLGPTPPADIVPEGEMGSITGKVTTFFATQKTKLKNEEPTSETDIPVPDGILSLSTSPDFTDPMMVPLFLDENGRYLIDVKPGQYYILAVVDNNKDGQSGTSDGIGVYGTHQPVRGNPAPVTVFAGKITPHVDIDIMAAYVDENGTMSEIADGGRWNISRMFGEPEDIFKYTRQGKLIEEWMYWTVGIGFQFEAQGAGWILKNRTEFDPKTQNIKEASETSEVEEQKKETGTDPEIPLSVGLNGFSIASQPISIYYSHDGVVWRIAPATADDIGLNNLRSVPIDSRASPLGPGFRPSVSENGMLVYHDFDRNVVLRDTQSGKSTIYLDNRKLAEDVAISADGEYIAYSHKETNDRKRIIIQHLRSEKTFRIPSTAREMTNPAWRADGKLLAYATAGSIENPAADTNRNIYAYDHVNNSVEPIVISPADDAEPAWHPSDPNTLVFTRQIEDDIPQIWIVSFSTTGKRTEGQITKMGGTRPVWIPSEGQWILYENNGQLWTVDPLTPGSEAPLMSNGKPVFGYQPAAISIE